MSNAQNNFADQFKIAGDLLDHQPVIRGSQAGIVSSPDTFNDLDNVILTDVRSPIQQANLIDLETWVDGQQVYAQLVNGTVRITQERTDLPFGFADCPKVASAKNTFVRIKEPHRDPDVAEIMMDFTNHVHLQANGLSLLRSFTGEGGSRFVHALEAEHDGSVAPGTATLSIGDGTAGNDQVLTATTFTALIGASVAHKPFSIALAAPVALSDWAISLALGPMTGGRFHLRLFLASA